MRRRRSDSAFHPRTRESQSERRDSRECERHSSRRNASLRGYGLGPGYGLPDYCAKCSGGDPLRLERLAGSLDYTLHYRIDRDERRVRFRLNIHFPLAAVDSLDRVAIARRKNGVAVDDDLAILLFDREILLAGA